MAVRMMLRQPASPGFSQLRSKAAPLGVQAFLLSLQHGAAGLTLVRANHVFLLDIAADPAIEQQAVVSEAVAHDWNA